MRVVKKQDSGEPVAIEAMVQGSVFVDTGGDYGIRTSDGVTWLGGPGCDPGMTTKTWALALDQGFVLSHAELQV